MNDSSHFGARAMSPSGKTTEGVGTVGVVVCGEAGAGKSCLIERLVDDAAAAAGGAEGLPIAGPRPETSAAGGPFSRMHDGWEHAHENDLVPDVMTRAVKTPTRVLALADLPAAEPASRTLSICALQADVAVVVVDAIRGLTDQAERQANICSLMGIRHIVLVVNKMDLVGFAQDVFYRTAADFAEFCRPLGFASIVAVPASASSGDNVVTRSVLMPWYQGPTLRAHLQAIDVAAGVPVQAFRFPVARVLQTGAGLRGIAGIVASGDVRVGVDVVSAISGRQSRIERIVAAEGDVQAAARGDAVTLMLADDIDVACGDLVVPATERPEVSDQFAAQLLWLDDTHLLPGRSYDLVIGARRVSASVTVIKHRVDMLSRQHLAARNLEINEIGVCNLATSAPIAFDAFADNRATGSFLLVDRMTQATAAVGMIMFGLRRATNIHVEELIVDKSARATAKNQRPTVIWFTGLSGSGKSTIAKRLEKRLHDLGNHTYVLDGDNVRHGLNQDLGFTDTDRVENIRRIGEVAKLFADAGLIVMCAFISPFRAERRMVRELLKDDEFVEVYVDASIVECQRRDPKGLYAKALAGKVKNFTGIDSPYESPERAEIHLTTENVSPDVLVDQILGYLREKGRI